PLRSSHPFPTRRSSDLGLESGLPEPLGRTSDPSPLDRGRLYVLRGLVERWRVRSAWQTLREIVSAAPVQKGAETGAVMHGGLDEDRKSTRLNSSHVKIS